MGKKQRGTNAAVEAVLAKKFPPPTERDQYGELPELREPALVVDVEDVCIAWSLPGVLSCKVQETIVEAVSAYAAAEPCPLKVDGTTDRDPPELFREGDLEMGAGLSSMAWCWFPQSHEVSNFISAPAA